MCLPLCTRLPPFFPNKFLSFAHSKWHKSFLYFALSFGTILFLKVFLILELLVNKCIFWKLNNNIHGDICMLLFYTWRRASSAKFWKWEFTGNICFNPSPLSRNTLSPYFGMTELTLPHSVPHHYLFLSSYVSVHEYDDIVCKRQVLLTRWRQDGLQLPQSN